MEATQGNIEFERHFSVIQIAEMWNLGVDKTRELFTDEPDVVHIGKGERRFCRGYITLRVPASVVRRVHTRLKVKH
jgi:hypothetical protein